VQSPFYKSTFLKHVIVIADQRQKAQPHTKFKQSWDKLRLYTWKEYGNYVKSTPYNDESTAYDARTTSYNGERTAYRLLSIMAKAPRIMLEPLRILNSESTAYNARTTAYRQNAVWSLTPAMAFHKRKPKMKDDHIACLPYACLLGKNSLPAGKQCIVVGRNTPKRSRFHLHI
jgi:hypothetical protein